MALAVVVTACSEGTETPAAAPLASASAAPSATSAPPSATAAPAPTATAGPARAAGRPQVQVFSTGLEVPWDLAFLPAL